MLRLGRRFRTGERLLATAVSALLLAQCDIMLEPVDAPAPAPSPTQTDTPAGEPGLSPETPDAPVETDVVQTPDETVAPGEGATIPDDGMPTEGSVSATDGLSPPTEPDSGEPPSSGQDDAASSDTGADQGSGDGAPGVVETPADEEGVLAPSPVETPTPGPVPSDVATEPSPSPSASPEPAVPTAFDYYAPGDLEPNSGSGARGETVYVPDMVFPIKDAPAHPQSQVYRFGGGVAGGDQCDPRNFSTPWRDNFCEKRSRTSSSPYCPGVGVHLGQDIRVGTPEGCNAERRTAAKDRKRYAVVAVEDGVISNIGSYTVNVRSGGRIYRYMHMNMRALKVSLGQTVKAGDVLGYVSNDFGGTPTTLHLHFEIKLNTAEHGWTFAPPYSSLVKAYERREGAAGRNVSDPG